MEIIVLVGNPKPRSRTREVAEAVADRIAHSTGADRADTIDLCDVRGTIFDWPDAEMAALNDRVAATDVLVVASPTYKAAYTGLLKAFLDRFPNDGLAGVTAVPVMTGAGGEHAMAVDTSLRPLLVELGASVPTGGLYFPMSQMDRLDPVVDSWASRHLGALLGLATDREGAR